MSERLPHFLGDMRCHRRQKPGQRFDGETPRAGGLGALLAKIADGVGKRVELRHRLVEAERLDVLRHRHDGAMRGAHEFGAGTLGRQRTGSGGKRRVACHAIQPFQEARRALDPGLGPFHVALGRRVRQHEQPRGIGAVGGDDQLGVDDIAFRLAHLLDPTGSHRRARLKMTPALAVTLDLGREQPFAVPVTEGLVADHALCHQPGEWFVEIQIAGFAKGAGEEARIEKMQHRMLDAADILVDGHPVGGRLGAEAVLVMRVGKAQEVPGALEKRVEGILFADRVLAADRAGNVLPCRVVRQRVARRIERHILGKLDRKIGLRHRHHAAVVAMDDRDRTAPVALP